MNTGDDAAERDADGKAVPQTAAGADADAKATGRATAVTPGLRRALLPDDQLDVRVRSAFDPETRKWASSHLGGDAAWSVDYFVRFFHNPLRTVLGNLSMDALECASGYGLNAIAYLLSGGASIRGYDIDQARIAFASELAERLGLGDRASFQYGDIHALPASPSVGVVFTLQTLEHVPRPLEALRALADRAEKAIVISTPNRLFPIDGHDTGLAFAHWLSNAQRKRYASWRGAPTAQLCSFLSAFDIDATIPDFELRTHAYNFARLSDWLDQYPCFFPYGPDGGRWLGARKHRFRWRCAKGAFRVAGAAARMVAPVLEGIYVRR